MFSVTLGKGFHMTFKNGVTASVQWGPGNYCENSSNYNLEEDTDKWFARVGAKGCEHAEVAALDAKGNFITQQVMHAVGVPLDEMYDDVVGWCDADKVLEFLNACHGYKEE